MAKADASAELPGSKTDPGSRIGAELVLTSNNRAKVESYYRFFKDNRQPA